MGPGRERELRHEVVAVDGQVARRERRALGEDVRDVRLERRERREVGLGSRGPWRARRPRSARRGPAMRSVPTRRIQRRTAASVHSDS